MKTLLAIAIALILATGAAGCSWGPGTGGDFCVRYPTVCD